MPEESCCAILVAAGNSSRMGMGMSKQFLLLGGKPVIVHTLLAFERAASISSIVVVCRPEDQAAVQCLVDQHAIGKLCAVVAGGATRQRSVAAGLAAVPKETEYLAIHDGARPLIRPEEIDATVQDARTYGAAALCTLVKDTIKMQNTDGFVCSTPDRSSLRAVQTPQVFEASIIIEAYSRMMEKEQITATDDAMAVEQELHLPVRMTEGSYENIKITTPEDLEIAEVFARRCFDAEKQ